jgi:type IV pilus assembly protein PilK
MTQLETAVRINESKPEIAPLERDLWRDLIDDRCGICFVDSRMHHLQACLWERMRLHGIGSYLDYHQYVSFGAGGDKEWEALLELLVNCETSFFRHEPSFRSLAYLLPYMMRDKRRRSSYSLNLWSAGCSSGQETYSIAITALQAANLEPWRLHVRGSDISETALAKARRGRYTTRAVQGIPDPLRKRYLSEVAFSGQETLYEVHAHVRAVVEFAAFNLMRPATYGGGWQDVIFCQNVLIYFRDAVREQIAHRLARRLNLGGVLFFGPGEMPGLKLPGAQTVWIDGSPAYQRVE